MTGRKYRRARIQMAAMLGLILVAAPSTPLPSLSEIDWPTGEAIASTVHIPHLSVRIAIEVTP